MKTFAAALLFSAILGAQTPAVAPAAMKSIEKSLDRRIERANLINPMLLLGYTRGIYLDGYGLVLTAEINLLPVAITPFRPALTKEQIGQLNANKQERLPQVRKIIREVLLEAAGIAGVPEHEQIVVGINLFNFSWEDTTGLPAQIVMQAPRKTLLQFRPDQQDQALSQTLKVREF